MRLTAKVILGLTVLFIPGSLVTAQTTPTQAYIVVINPQNKTESIDKKFLSDAFLKKVTRWNNNETIKPVDLQQTSSIRKRFTEQVLKKSVPEVKSYWQQKIFAGYDLPPPELDADSEVIKFILKYPGAIGYVSSEADITSVKILTVK